MLICYAVAIPVCTCIACCSMTQEKWKNADNEQNRKHTDAIRDAIKKIGPFTNSNNDKKTPTMAYVLKNMI